MGVVVITGCSSGFGLEASLAFARRGDTVVASMRDLAKADALSKRAAAENLTVHLEQLDVCDDASVEAAIRGVVRSHGTVDVLVNNAGVVSGGPVETVPMDTAFKQLDTNFWGPLRAIRAVLPTMRAQRSGVIINVSSIAGRLPATPYGSMYAASKQALNAVSEALEYEVAPFGIRVVSIEPGFSRTEILAKRLGSDDPVSDVYAADAQWVQSFVGASVDNGADPGVVAEAIVAAASDPGTPLHTPVGDDAAMYLDLLNEVDGYEGWREALTIQVEAALGPRPGLGRTSDAA
ncbi:MAG: SDR family oxidoreductase [Acidimicrobiia bacterium]|nr:SDR family oxidoreductase [Acidimicrobiia bacterium]